MEIIIHMFRAQVVFVKCKDVFQAGFTRASRHHYKNHNRLTGSKASCFSEIPERKILSYIQQMNPYKFPSGKK